MRLVHVGMHWTQAETYCKGFGEKLATLTEASVDWWKVAQIPVSMAHLLLVYVGIHQLFGWQ